MMGLAVIVGARPDGRDADRAPASFCMEVQMLYRVRRSKGRVGGRGRSSILGIERSLDRKAQRENDYQIDAEVSANLSQRQPTWSVGEFFWLFDKHAQAHRLNARIGRSLLGRMGAIDLASADVRTVDLKASTKDIAPMFPLEAMRRWRRIAWQKWRIAKSRGAR